MRKSILNPTAKLQPQTELVVMTDEELLLNYRRTHDRQAFEELVQRYERELYSYLRRYLNDNTLAEDAFQATFLQLHLKCEQFDEGAKLRPWLYTIATNQAIDALRKNRRHKLVSLDRQNGAPHESEVGTLAEVLESGIIGPHSQLQDAEQRDWVREAVAGLPEHLRSVVVMIYNQGLKYREAADILKVPVGTIKSRLHAAIQKLNDAWNRSSMAQEKP